MSVVWFSFVALLTVGGLTGLAKMPIREWIQNWQVVITVMLVFLLPYLIIASMVWGVDLAILSARASSVPVGDAKEKPEMIPVSKGMEPPGTPVA